MKLGENLISLSIMIGPIVVIPLISPDNWGPAMGIYFQMPLFVLSLFGPLALLFFIFASFFHRVMIFYYGFVHLIKPNLDFQSQIEHHRDNGVQNEGYLGSTIMVFIAAYFYHVMIAWYCGLDIYSPKEAMDFVIEMIAASGSDYD